MVWILSTLDFSLELAFRFQSFVFIGAVLAPPTCIDIIVTSCPIDNIVPTFIISYLFGSKVWQGLEVWIWSTLQRGSGLNSWLPARWYAFILVIYSFEVTR